MSDRIPSWRMRSEDFYPVDTEEERQNDKHHLRRCASTFCSLALGSCGLGTMLHFVLKGFVPELMNQKHSNTNAAQAGFILQSFYGIIGVLSLFVFLSKALRHPKQMYDELGSTRPHAALVSSGTMSIAIMAEIAHDSFSNYGEGAKNFAVAVWLIGYILHVLLMVNFAYRRIRHRAELTWLELTPAWFVVYVGFCNFAVNSVGLHVSPAAVKASLYLGIIHLLWQLPLLSYRLFFKPPMPSDIMPNVGIYMAPSSLCTAGWFATAKELEWVRHGGSSVYLGIGGTLMILGILTAAYVAKSYSRMFVSVKPLPNWASYTFPHVIFAVALMKTTMAVKDPVWLHLLLVGMSWIAIINATIIVNIVIFVAFLGNLNDVATALNGYYTASWREFGTTRSKGFLGQQRGSGGLGLQQSYNATDEESDTSPQIGDETEAPLIIGTSSSK